tara:strand:+ start:402 stop:1121 length:720 start_codon:yes stop_codon:yes gene_type:complete
MSKLFQIIKWVMLIFLLIIVLGFTEKKSSRQLVYLKKIDIERSEEKFVDVDLVLKYIKKNKIEYDDIIFSELSIYSLEQLLLEHPSIKSAEVYVYQNGEINIKIKQRKAIARFRSHNEDYYLDQEGYKMPLSKHYTSRVVILTGDIQNIDIGSVYKFIDYISSNDFWRSQIIQIDLSADEVILIPRIGNHKIHLGALVNTSEKLEKLYHFYRQAMPIMGWQTYSDINLKYNNQIICTKK